MVPLTEGAPTRHISVTEIERQRQRQRLRERQRQRQRLRERQTQTQRLLRKTKTWPTLLHHLVTLVSLSQKHCHSFLREKYKQKLAQIAGLVSKVCFVIRRSG